MAAHVSTLYNSRLKTMVIPREHGAWGMMLVPLATGAVVALRAGINGGALTLFILAAMSLFWLRTPVEAWLGTSAIKAQTEQERAFVLRMIAGIALLAAASIASLLWNGCNRGLLPIGAVAALAFAMQAVVKKFGRKGRMPAQVIGAVGLTATAAGAYYVATGKLDHVALALWLAPGCSPETRFTSCSCAFAPTAQQTPTRGCSKGFPSSPDKWRSSAPFSQHAASVCFPLLLLWRLFPCCFAELCGSCAARQPLDVHKLGFSELAQALVFGALLCAAFLV